MVEFPWMLKNKNRGSEVVCCQDVQMTHQLSSTAAGLVLSFCFKTHLETRQKHYLFIQFHCFQLKAVLPRSLVDMPFVRFTAAQQALAQSPQRYIWYHSNSVAAIFDLPLQIAMVQWPDLLILILCASQRNCSVQSSIYGIFQTM